MSSHQAAQDPGAEGHLLRRIADLESEIKRLQQTHGIGEAPLPAREALLTEVERIAHRFGPMVNVDEVVAEFERKK